MMLRLHGTGPLFFAVFGFTCWVLGDTNYALAARILPRSCES